MHVPQVDTGRTHGVAASFALRRTYMQRPGLPRSSRHRSASASSKRVPDYENVFGSRNSGLTDRRSKESNRG